MTTPPRHDPSTIQLSARIPRELHSRFYAACRKQEVTGSEVLRLLLESYVNVMEGARNGQA